MSLARTNPENKTGPSSDRSASAWWGILGQVWRQQSADNISVVSAGVAFYTLLSIFPALAAAVSIYAIFAEPSHVQSQAQSLSGAIPGQAQVLLQSELGRIVADSRGALSAGLIGGILLALWSATKGVKALMTALNIAYHVKEHRGFVKLNATALLLTFGAVVMGLIALALVVALPVALNKLGLGLIAKAAFSWIRWAVLAAGMVAVLAALYRLAPDRSPTQGRWLTWGSAVATLLWIAGSLLFSYYVANFGSYNKTYGSLGAVIILLMWFYLSAYVVLLGAEVNATLEHRHSEGAGTDRPYQTG